MDVSANKNTLSSSIAALGGLEGCLHHSLQVSHCYLPITAYLISIMLFAGPDTTEHNMHKLQCEAPVTL